MQKKFNETDFCKTINMERVTDGYEKDNLDEFFHTSMDNYYVIMCAGQYTSVIGTRKNKAYQIMGR